HARARPVDRPRPGEGGRGGPGRRRSRPRRGFLHRTVVRRPAAHGPRRLEPGRRGPAVPRVPGAVPARFRPAVREPGAPRARVAPLPVPRPVAAARTAAGPLARYPRGRTVPPPARRLARGRAGALERPRYMTSTLSRTCSLRLA